MENNEKTTQIGEETMMVTKTPMFSAFRLWWKAKKESLDLWGLEKYLGCDNRQFKNAVHSYKNLVHEIEQEYQETISDHTLGVYEKEEAKKNRDRMLLDAKRDFIYSLPENYRTWFKKKKVFHSWWSEPSSWGFHESRYWGSRSGLTLRERRVVLVTLILGFLGLIVLLFIATTQEKVLPERQTSWDMIERPSRNIDSLIQEQLTRERRDERRRTVIERNNRIINQLNSGYYIPTTGAMRAEVKMLMEFYHDIVYKQPIPKNVITPEAISTACGIIATNNPQAILKRDAAGNPIQWKVGTRVNVTWADINYGLQSYYKRKKLTSK